MCLDTIIDQTNRLAGTTTGAIANNGAPDSFADDEPYTCHTTSARNSTQREERTIPFAAFASYTLELIGAAKAISTLHTLLTRTLADVVNYTFPRGASNRGLAMPTSHRTPLVTHRQAMAAT
jgi:hypothetical protein